MKYFFVKFSIFVTTILPLYLIRFTPTWALFPHILFWTLFILFLYFFIKEKKKVSKMNRLIVSMFVIIYCMSGVIRSTGLINNYTKVFCHDHFLFVKESNEVFFSPIEITNCEANKIYIFYYSLGLFGGGGFVFFEENKAFPILHKKLDLAQVPIIGDRTKFDCSGQVLSIKTDEQLILRINTQSWKYQTFPYENKNVEDAFKLF